MFKPKDLDSAKSDGKKSSAFVVNTLYPEDATDPSWKTDTATLPAECGSVLTVNLLNMAPFSLHSANFFNCPPISQSVIPLHIPFETVKSHCPSDPGTNRTSETMVLAAASNTTIFSTEMSLPDIDAAQFCPMR